MKNNLKRLQFARINNLLEDVFGEQCSIESMSMIDSNHNIIKLGFRPRKYIAKQLVIFDKETGKYQLGTQEIGSVGIYTDCIGYSIKDLRKMLEEIYPNLVQLKWYSDYKRGK